MRYFAFRWRPARDKPASYLVIAAAAATLEPKEITSVLDEDHEINLNPDGIIFVVPAVDHQGFVDGVRKLLADGTLLRMDVQRVGAFVALFDKFGECERIEHLHGPAADAWPAGAFEDIKKSGLEDIFLKRKVLMLAGPGLHFRHPRGVHSRGFLRGANAFVNGAEIGFVAMTLLRYLPEEAPKQIWLDTSSIAAVAYALTALRLTFDKSFAAPHIESFSSYDGLETTELTHARRSLFLISATASGGMAHDIVEREQVDTDRVVNLFSAAQGVKHLTVLLDVSKHPAVIGSDGLSLLRIAPESACPWCNDNSRLVRFVSDQFLADSIKYTEVTIAEKDAPPGLRETAHTFAQRQAFVLDRRSETGNHRFWIDLSRESTEALVASVSGAVRRFVPIAVSHVIFLGDAGSERLAGAVADEIAAQRAQRPDLVPAAKAADLEPDKAKAVVVVASCIGSGNGLQIVSRDLREVLRERPKSYFVRFAKHAEPARQKTLRGDLAHNKSFPHEFACLNELTLPTLDLNAWAKELELMKRLEETELQDDGKRFVEKRIELLSRDRIGGDQNLFLRTPTEQTLKLSAGFAFWRPGYNSECVSHGDVLATMAAVLQHLRTSKPHAAEEPKLASTPFHTSVISPRTYGRFNDGVIQAALLRSAHAHELNYAGRPELSSAMLRIVQRTLERWDASQGEAAPEFLLALATRRMVLSEADTRRLVADGPHRSSTVLRVLLDAIAGESRARPPAPAARPRRRKSHSPSAEPR